jgi:hypothetical protein
MNPANIHNGQLCTTLADIRNAWPCHDGWRKLLKHFGDMDHAAPLPFTTILESNGLDDALWCLKALPSEWEGEARELACRFAETALPFVPEGEDRPRKAIETARAYISGNASRDDLTSAWDAAESAADSAAEWAAGAAARSAAWAAVRADQKQIFKDWLAEVAA